MEDQNDPQNLQKWRSCLSKLQQEQLLVQQLETEAAQMQLAETNRDNAAHSSRENRHSLVPPAAQQLHSSKSESEGVFMSLPAWSGSAADSRGSRRQSQPQHVRSKGFKSHDSPLRRSSSYGTEGIYEPEYRSQDSRGQLGRHPSPLRRGSASAYSDVEADSGSAAREVLPRMRRSRQTATSQQGRRTPVCFATSPG